MFQQFKERAQVFTEYVGLGASGETCFKGGGGVGMNQIADKVP